VDSTLARAKAGRATKQMLGQFMTPIDLAQQVTEASEIKWTKDMIVLEPGFGRGAFLFQALEGLIKAHGSRSKKVIQHIFSKQLFGVEMDPKLYEATLTEIQQKYGPIDEHNLVNEDFFKTGYFDNYFDLIIGNPPYGGTFDPKIEDALDRKFGKWNGFNLKKETYSFFIAQSLDLLKDQGRLVFITSDTFLTINTMAGLRHRLMDQAKCRVTTLNYFSDETNQPVLVLDATRNGKTNSIEIENVLLTRKEMEATPNFSWKVSTELAPYFSTESLGDYIVCTSGMTIGNNELFVREIHSGHILESYDFEFFEEPITLERELGRARLNKLSGTIQQKIRLQEKMGETRRNVRIIELKEPKRIKLPSKDYRFYNKAANGIIYRKPKFVVFWKNEGEAVLTFKKNGNWYLHGVGGQKFFKREGMTWQLVAPRLNMKFLPEGYIFDSGAPCGFLRDGIEPDEFWFIFGWCITEKATEILKTVINHTRNIQSKDIERLPYPFWVTPARKVKAIALAKQLVEQGMKNAEFDRTSKEIVVLNALYEQQKKTKK
jgi:tRNA1(Val) A37 N6-methylase TrmN6